MSVGDKLGSGSSFGKVPHGRSPRGRAKAVAQGDVPAYELVRVLISDVAPTPLLAGRPAGSEAEEVELGEKLQQAQLTACVGVTRQAYLALWPEHEADVGSADVVLINGTRTYRAAVRVGLDALDFVVRDELAGSRTVLAESLDVEDDRPPVAVPLKLLAHNPFNPRLELTEIEETADSLRAAGQLQRVAVVTRAAFLAVHPDQAEAIADADYVVIDGNRRLAAAPLAGLDSLRIDVNESLAATAATMVEAALIANIHRVDLPAMDQARAVQQLLDVHGSQDLVAQRLGRTPAWVSQRLALLRLVPELQEQVDSGDLKLEAARRIGRMEPSQQPAEAKQAIAAARVPRERKPRSRQATEQAALNGVKRDHAHIDDAVASAAGGVNGVKPPTALPAAPSSEEAALNGVNSAAPLVPAQQHDEAVGTAPPAEQWADWLTTAELEDIANTLIKSLPGEVLTDLLHLVADTLRSSDKSSK